jgi:UDP-N-acetylmuramyl tripeptide synthase
MFSLTYNGLQIGGRFNAANVLLALVALRGLNELKTKIWQKRL